ncbi:MAG: hypothetical protein HFE77_06265 [Clostridiales bacterium]|nr:hypothetical protein [Clostridiales bacterium]
MKKVSITDVTIRKAAENGSLSFKEKIEIAKALDRLNVSAIELSPITNQKTDLLLIKTIASAVKNAAVSLPVGMSESEAELAWSAVSGAVRPRLVVSLPVSSVQMEFIARKKPAAMVETIDKLTRKCASLCQDVEFCAEDATRAEFEFLVKAIETAITAGAASITICDTAGIMLPEEFAAFVQKLYDHIPSLKNIFLKVLCNDALGLAAASSITAVGVGAAGIKATFDSSDAPQIVTLSNILSQRGDSLGIYATIKATELNRTMKQILRFTNTQSAMNTVAGHEGDNPDDEHIVYDANDDITAISSAIQTLGYDLAEEECAKVYEEFLRVAAKKPIGIKEIDAIVASTALQVPPTYKLESYVINTGNIISATAHIKIEKNGEMLTGISAGDGPIDAAFNAIEEVAGSYYELDDFQIRAVTEGKEAVGSAIVKLRYEGRLYSGSGISTDIIGAAIRAYIAAINKIVYESNN